MSEMPFPNQSDATDAADGDVPPASESPSTPIAAGAAITDAAVDGSAVQTDGAAAPSDEPAPTAPDDGADFLTELTRAMQAAAGEERQRAEADIARRRDEHLATIQERRSAEADRMKALADGDLRAIDAWAEGERERIDRERETRAAAVREDLQTSLAEHGSKIDREVEAVEAAIGAHRAEVEAFFTALDGETDPVAIALQARRRPAFPSLDALPDVTVAATQPEKTAPAGAGVPVMSGDPAPKLADAWANWSAARDAAPTTDATDPTPATAPTGPEQLEAVAVTSSANKPQEESTVLQTMAVSRPMSWLRRSSNGDGSDKDA